jgi:hypothetical protein
MSTCTKVISRMHSKEKNYIYCTNKRNADGESTDVDQLIAGSSASLPTRLVCLFSVFNLMLPVNA